MTGTPLEEPELPPSLRFLKRLVTVLTVTMIVGVITVVGLLVTRLQQSPPVPTLPEGLTLPAGASAAAVTIGTGWIAVVTTANHILIYDKDGILVQDLKIDIKSP
jgi:Family of unknown function (DUF6476)